MKSSAPFERAIYDASMPRSRLDPPLARLKAGPLIVIGRELGEHREIFERGRVALHLARGRISRSSRRMILPLRVLGSESVKRMSSGLAIGPISLATHWRNWFFNSSLGVAPPSA